MIPVWSKVVDATRSPLNARQWLVRLVCGHEMWITAATKPTAKQRKCHACWKKANP